MGFFALSDPKFWDRDDLNEEIDRVFTICHGCRLCFNLCPSFPHLFDSIDEAGDDYEKVTAEQKQHTVDLCYGCKLCYPKCPYIPPHEFAVDFPRLMLRAKAVKAREEGLPLSDRLLEDPDMIGKVGSMMPGLTNWANRNPLNRIVMEKLAGIHRDRELPEYQEQTFSEWWKKHKASRTNGAPATGGKGPAARVVLFPTCSVEYNDPETAIAAVEVLERSGVEVGVPEGWRCCGMPAFGLGDIDRTLEHMRDNVAALNAWVEKGYDIVTPGPSCTLMIRTEYPELTEDEMTHRVAEHTFDLMEYLYDLDKDGKLDRDFQSHPEKVAYHLPCHLKVQNIGFRSRDVLEMTGAKVGLVDRCSCMDGTWGMKKEFYGESVKWAGKLTRQLERENAECVSTDCYLAGIQIKQKLGTRPEHPIKIVRKAYDKDEEE